MRYLPPNATAGFATLDVRTPRRLPCPPANSMAIISFLIISSPLSSLPPVVINSRSRLLSDVSICLEKAFALSFGCDNSIITHWQWKVNIYYWIFLPFYDFYIHFLHNYLLFRVLFVNFYQYIKIRFTKNCELTHFFKIVPTDCFFPLLCI